MAYYELQTYTLCDGWINTWKDNNDAPISFDTREQAERELEDFFEDLRDAVECGDLEDYDHDDFRVAEVSE